MVDQRNKIGAWDDGGGLKWLYADMNSFFASVEQQENPRFRGRPVIVTPVTSDFTAAIAASKEAKAYGVKTGTLVKEAKRLCPNLIIIEARPDRYVHYHHRIISEINTVLPVDKVCSIDEMACRLMGPETEESEARRLGRRIQEVILKRVGECLTASIGIGPSRLLAKTAADMKKPLGLTVLRKDELPGPLLQLKLEDFAGIGWGIKERLKGADVESVEQLWALPASRLRQIWGGVVGDNFYYALHGIDPPDQETVRSSVSHSHVLAQALRPVEEAYRVARRLTIKCGSRLRRMGYKCGAMSVYVRGEKGARGGADCHFSPSADSFKLLSTLESLWKTCPLEPRLKTVSVTCFHLTSAECEPDLFGWTPEQEENQRNLRLLNAVDRLNQRYGKDAVSIGPYPAVHAFVGAKIAFNRVPDFSEFRE